MLRSVEECSEFIATESSVKIADQLRRDQQTCREGGIPSLLGVILPSYPPALAEKIAFHLSGGTSKSSVSKSLQKLQYRGLLQGIKAHIDHLGDRISSDPTYTRSRSCDSAESNLLPSEIDVTLKVLKHLEADGSCYDIDSHSSLQEIRDALNGYQEELQDETPSSDSLNTVILHISRRCYICHVSLPTTAHSHPLYTSLCRPCGLFNLSCSNLSDQSNLDLTGKIALVTGSRVNLGFHVTLKLLRCNAQVIATSRYPRDAECRFRRLKDFDAWKDRLRIVGADFRTAKDVFALISVVKSQLGKWNERPRLDILINNAAQTLTDSIEAEEQAVKRESTLRLPGNGALLLHDSEDYTASVRGGSQPFALALAEEHKNSKFLLEAPNQGFNDDQNGSPPINSLISNRYTSRPPSSWTQHLANIPYEDLISAHSVNTFVPFILTRELLPLMGKSLPSTSRDPEPSINDLGIPYGFIVNVSSREGIFDSLQAARMSGASPSSNGGPSTAIPKQPPRKTAHHTHTNMTKAALNMFTETEAKACWHDKRVAMNSVDPGYMSAAEGFGIRHGEEDLPIGWDDGAGRVLWPIAVGWGDGQVDSSGKKEAKVHSRAIWGKFLKHYQPTPWGGEGML